MFVVLWNPGSVISSWYLMSNLGIDLFQEPRAIAHDLFTLIRAPVSCIKSCNSIPDCPARSQSLYRLSYTAHYMCMYKHKILNIWCNILGSDVLLTVHLSMFISAINQLDAQNFCFTISMFHASTCFEHMCSSPGGQNCITQPVEAWNKLIVKQKVCASSWLIT